VDYKRFAGDCDFGHSLGLISVLLTYARATRVRGSLMSRFIAFGFVFTMLAAGATAKTLKVITKAEVVQHRPAGAVQQRPTPAEPADPAILHKHLQIMREEMTQP